MMIAESNVYDRQMITPTDEGGVGFDAEWCDDFLHSVFAVVRPGEDLSNRTYNDQDLARVLQCGCVYEGSLSDPQRDRRDRPGRVETSRLIYCIQNHDFIGNHPLGQRFHQLTSLETQAAAAALLLLSPAIPMLFMGEEYACSKPFQFFVDFSDESLREAVVQGRRREYPQHDWTRGVLPTDEDAFLDSKIGTAADGNPRMLRWYRELISLRRQWKKIGLLNERNYAVEIEPETGTNIIRYDDGTRIATIAVRLARQNADDDLGRPDSDQPDSNQPDSNQLGAIPMSLPGTRLLDSRDAAGDHLLTNHATIFFWDRTSNETKD